MKRITLVLGAFLALFIISCRGPEGLEGLPGRDGLNGVDGPSFEAAAFEIEIDMVLNTDSNRYEFAGEPYPSDITLIADDVVLMYRLEEVNNGFDVWRQLPQPLFSDNGLLYYNFDFTLNDYSIFVEPEFDAATIAASLVLDQVFRIVIIPANLGTSKVDKSNISAVLSSLGIEEKNIKKVQL